MHRRRLSEWQSRGLLLKVRNGFYRLAERPLTEHERWAIANRSYEPSYVSLRSALAYHGFIPEGVFHVESITTTHARKFTFNDTSFSYRAVRPSFYFGYRIIPVDGVRVLMAGPEKVLLDLLYLHPDVDGPEGFDAWRLDAEGILEKVDPERMDDYAHTGGSQALLTRYNRLKKWLHDHAG
ncbi:MAG: hypothetical protein KDB93_03425 [Flavobacteriales bacterium]|nr:hypothetical protein [Flavobacteriales bacterium]